mgnify:CR=1 FL=1
MEPASTPPSAPLSVNERSNERARTARFDCARRASKASYYRSFAAIARATAAAAARSASVFAAQCMS